MNVTYSQLFGNLFYALICILLYTSVLFVYLISFVALREATCYIAITTTPCRNSPYLCSVSPTTTFFPHLSLYTAPSLAGDLVVKAVDTFYKLYGNYKIPLEFQVPTNSESPFKKRSEMVPKVSSSSSDETLPYRWPYKPVEPIPYDFWPPEVRGMKLGFKFSNIYYSRSSVQLRNVLEAKGAFTDMEAPPYLWERSDSYGEVLQALKEFKMNFGHLNVPESFVVPADGQYLHPRERQSILTRGDHTTDQDTENLRDNGLNENTDAINDDEKSRVFVDYTRAYVPSEEYLAMTWSKKSQRIKLGLKVRDLRFKAKYLAKNRAELDAIGFNWKYVDPEEEDSID